MNIKNKKGITLISLLITIIILLILAGVTIYFSFREDGIISRAKEAKFKQEMTSYKEEVQVYVANSKLKEILKGEVKTINAGIHSQNPNMQIEKVIKDLKQEYKNKVEIENNEFEYVPINLKSQDTAKEIRWCFEAHIKVKGFETLDDFENRVEIPDGEYTLINGVYACSPNLTGFDYEHTYYVYYDETGKEMIGNKVTKSMPDNWYDYANKKWANIVTINGDQMAYFVWIPRYVYKIDDEANEKQETKILFVDKNDNHRDFVTNKITNYSNGTDSKTQYCLPDSFTWEGTELAGFWMSKYELSSEKAGVTINVGIGETYINVVEMKTMTDSQTEIATVEYYLNGELIEVTNGDYKYENLTPHTLYDVKIIVRDVEGAIIGAKIDRITTLEKPMQELTKPDLTGFNEQNTYYVYYDETGKEIIGDNISKPSPNDWYNYDEKKWANIVTISGDQMAYFVWIPRYEYRLNNGGETVETRFISKEQINPTSTYKIPDSFTWDGTPLAGYWMSKYELSTEKIGVTINVGIGETYINVAEIKKITGTQTDISTVEYYLNGELIEITNGDYKYENLAPNTLYDVRIIARDVNGTIIGAKIDKIKTLEKSIQELTKPDITGFNLETTFYVTYNELGEEDSSIPLTSPAPSNWYNYDEKKWANIVTKKGEGENEQLAYFVWIPRYEYRLNNGGETVEARFISKEQINPTSGYKIPDSFTWDGKQVSGYWMSKYELSADN